MVETVLALATLALCIALVAVTARLVESVGGDRR